MNDSEEKRLTLSELRALAEKQDKQDGPWKKEEELPEVSLEELLALGGKKTGNQIVFGPEGKTQLIFRPSKGMVGRAPARWTISLKGKTSAYDTQRELSRANHGLWDKGEGKDKEQGQPAVAFKAARQLLACHAEVQAKQETVLSIGPEVAEGAPYIYPKPEIETLIEELAKAEDELNEERNQRTMAHDAISLTIEVLSKGDGGKVQKAFDLLQRDQWPGHYEAPRICHDFGGKTSTPAYKGRAEGPF
jgi:hypothetical protein